MISSALQCSSESAKTFLQFLMPRLLSQIFCDRVMKSLRLSNRFLVCSFGKQHNFSTSLPLEIGRPNMIFIAVIHSESSAFAVMFTINAGFGCQAWLHSKKERWHVERWSKDVAYARNTESGCKKIPSAYITQQCTSNKSWIARARTNDVGCVHYINNSLHLARKYARIFVCGHYLFREANSFPRAKLEENCELRGTDNVQGQISVHILKTNGDYCVYYLSNIFRTVAREFWKLGNITWIGEYHSDILQFWLGHIVSRYAFWPIARERKYLMDYKSWQCTRAT